MDLYIDRENLKSFISSRENDDFDDCCRMIKRQLHVIYNMDKQSIKNDPILSQWILRINTGRGDSEDTDTFLIDSFPIRPIKSNSYINWDRKKLTSIYLIDDVESDKLKRKGCVLLGCIGEELQVLSKLFCGNDYDYHCFYELQRDFNSWNQLIDDNQTSPCTDIVINDRYLFNNTEDLVNHNMSQMLKALTHNVKSKVNVVIFTLKEPFFNFDPQKAITIVRKAVEGNTEIKPNITFIVSSDKSKIPHDRYIVTNYRLIKSGDSFLYFSTKDEIITHGSSFDIFSLAKKEYALFADDILKTLQKTYNDIAQRNKDLIIGSKVSNFVKF